MSEVGQVLWQFSAIFSCMSQAFTLRPSADPAQRPGLTQKFKARKLGTVELAQGLREFVALIEDPGSIPSIHRTVHNQMRSP